MDEDRCSHVVFKQLQHDSAIFGVFFSKAYGENNFLSDRTGMGPTPKTFLADCNIIAYRTEHEERYH